MSEAALAVPSPQDFDRVAIIGDVHGCPVELERIIGRLVAHGFGHEDLLVFVGDLVDKGPDWVGVVRYVQGLREQGWPVVMVQGNHDEKHADWRRAVAVAKEKGTPVRKKDPDRLFESFNSALTQPEIAFLDSAVLWYAVPWADALVVHAGILPGMLPNPLELPDLSSLSELSRKQRDRVSRVTRLRWWRPGEGDAGKFVAMGQEQPGDRYWAELYDGRFGRVYFGHEPFSLAAGPVCFPNATALDLGLVQGGKLAAVVLERGREPWCVVADAERAYASRKQGVKVVNVEGLPECEPLGVPGGEG